MEELVCIERYFAFPGLQKIARLKKSLEASELVSMSNRVTEITRQLASDAYGGYSRASLDDEENEDLEDVLEDGSGPRKNYFEAVFVEDMSESEELALKRKL